MKLLRKLSSDSKRVAVAMSGGIDSSVAAMILQEQGYDCIGFFMRNWDSSDELGQEACPIDKDREDMIAVCRRLSIPYYSVDFTKEYWINVFEPVIDGYRSGTITPNPDTLCNRHIKFHSFQNYVQSRVGIDKIATGHYARLSGNISANSSSLCNSAESNKVSTLRRGKDGSKDQSYFLCLTSGAALMNVLFPLGDLTKKQVRSIAASRLEGLSVLSKPESMGMCFIGPRARTIGRFMSQYIQPTPGRFVDIDTGVALDRHEGMEFFTVGQKARIKSMPRKYYVVSRCSTAVASGVENNNSEFSLSTYRLKCTPEGGCQVGDVYVAKGSDHEALYSDQVLLRDEDINWISGQMPAGLANVCQSILTSFGDTSKTLAQTFVWHTRMQPRHLDPAVPCSVKPILRYIQTPNSKNDSNSEHNKFRFRGANKGVQWDLLLQFESPQLALCPGQVAALYDGDICLGGAPIYRTGLNVLHIHQSD